MANIPRHMLNATKKIQIAPISIHGGAGDIVIQSIPTHEHFPIHAIKRLGLDDIPETGPINDERLVELLMENPKHKYFEQFRDQTIRDEYCFVDYGRTRGYTSFKVPRSLQRPCTLPNYDIKCDIDGRTGVGKIVINNNDVSANAFNDLILVIEVNQINGEVYLDELMHQLNTFIDKLKDCNNISIILVGSRVHHLCGIWYCDQLHKEIIKKYLKFNKDLLETFIPDNYYDAAKIVLQTIRINKKIPNVVFVTDKTLGKSKYFNYIAKIFAENNIYADVITTKHDTTDDFWENKLPVSYISRNLSSALLDRANKVCYNENVIIRHNDVKIFEKKLNPMTIGDTIDIHVEIKPVPLEGTYNVELLSYEGNVIKSVPVNITNVVQPTIDLHTEDEELCKICLTDNRDSIIVPCGHCCACNACALELKSRGQKCPICRGPITVITKLYLS